MQFSTVQYSFSNSTSLSITPHVLNSLVWGRDGTDALESCEDGMLSAVLDMDEVELYLSERHSSPENKDQLVMPGAQQVSREYL